MPHICVRNYKIVLTRYRLLYIIRLVDIMDIGVIRRFAQ